MERGEGGREQAVHTCPGYACVSEEAKQAPVGNGRQRQAAARKERRDDALDKGAREVLHCTVCTPSAFPIPDPLGALLPRPCDLSSASAS